MISSIPVVLIPLPHCPARRIGIINSKNPRTEVAWVLYSLMGKAGYLRPKHFLQKVSSNLIKSKPITQTFMYLFSSASCNLISQIPAHQNHKTTNVCAKLVETRKRSTKGRVDRNCDKQRSTAERSRTVTLLSLITEDDQLLEQPS